MSTINIQGHDDIDDPYYRYKMQKLNVVHQKNKTIIDNIEKVCSDIKVEPKILYSFFKKKFSVSMNLDKSSILSTTAKISYSDFEKVLREFIEEYVLCKNCKLPELEIKFDKNKISRSCKSCSFKESIKK